MVRSRRPNLAGFVQSFTDEAEEGSGLFNEPRWVKGRHVYAEDILSAAAKNMTSLRRAYIKANIMGTQIVANLGLYPRLTELTPGEHHGLIHDTPNFAKRTSILSQFDT